MVQAQFSQQFILRKAGLVLMVLFSIANAACSTPPARDQQEVPEIAWSEYLTCLEQVPRGSSSSVCDSVGTSRAQTSSQYTNSLNGGFTSYGSGRQRFAASVQAGPIDETARLNAYHEYLRTLDPQDLKLMISRWQDLRSH